VTYAKQLPGTVLVGENTGGVGEFGELKSYLLPSSRLWVQAGTEWFTSHGVAVRAEETVGYMPDFWIDDPDADVVTKKLAACLARPECATKL
jgi:hypothetical protein